MIRYHLHPAAAASWLVHVAFATPDDLYRHLRMGQRFYLPARAVPSEAGARVILEIGVAGAAHATARIAWASGRSAGLELIGESPGLTPVLASLEARWAAVEPVVHDASCPCAVPVKPFTSPERPGERRSPAGWGGAGVTNPQLLNTYSSTIWKSSPNARKKRCGRLRGRLP